MWIIFVTFCFLSPTIPALLESYIYCHLLLLMSYMPVHAPPRLIRHGYTPVKLLVSLLIDFVRILYARVLQRHMILILTCAFVINFGFLKFV